jgi:hypothetical protein
MTYEKCSAYEAKLHLEAKLRLRVKTPISKALRAKSPLRAASIRRNADEAARFLAFKNAVANMVIKDGCTLAFLAEVLEEASRELADSV